MGKDQYRIDIVDYSIQSNINLRNLIRFLAFKYNILTFCQSPYSFMPYSWLMHSSVMKITDNCFEIFDIQIDWRKDEKLMKIGKTYC